MQVSVQAVASPVGWSCLMAQTPAGRRSLHSSRCFYAAAALLSLLLLAPGCCSSLLDGVSAAVGAGRTSSSSSTQEAGDMDAAVVIAAGEAAGAPVDTANSIQSEPDISNQVGSGMMSVTNVPELLANLTSGGSFQRPGVAAGAMRVQVSHSRRSLPLCPNTLLKNAAAIPAWSDCKQLSSAGLLFCC
jgi:hypothetical protein